MDAVLHLGGQEELHPAVAGLLKQVNEPGKKRGYELRTANALWGQKGHGFRLPFLRLTKKWYGAGFRRVDFAGDTEGARKTINDWVAKQTNDKIKDLFKKGILDGDTRLVLTNAIYFKGDWASQFKKDQTRERDFHLSAGKKVKVPFMQQSAAFGYHATKTFQALELPYAGKELSMVVLLPRKVDGLAELEKGLSAEWLGGWIGKLRKEEVDVQLPKFRLTSAFRLDRTLASLGMTDAFVSGRADFSGLDGTKRLFIQAVVHKAFVDVNEKGTEAAAATGVASGAEEEPQLPEFIANRPFVFLIREMRSGSILFLGRLANPK
jgi:serpin B